MLLTRTIAILLLTPALAVGTVAASEGVTTSARSAAQAPPVVQAGLHENDSGAISFNGSWTKTKDTSGDSGRNSHNAEGAGDSATFRFEGTRVQYIARKNPWLGFASIYIDGGFVQRVDLYSASSQFSQVVFDRSGLSSGVHEMRIVRDGQKNPASTTKNINLDAIRVFDSTPPSQVSGVQVEVLPTGARVSWSASPEPDLSHYEVFRGNGTTGSFNYIERLDPPATSLLDTGLLPGSAHRWTVVAVDNSGNRSNRATAVPASVPAREVFSPTLADCPSTTTTVANAAQLKSALQKATAGDVIRLSPGTYTGAFSLSVTGTAQQPVWICGPRSAVIDNGTTASGYGLHIYDSTSVRAVGFTVQNVRKGVSVSTGSDIVVSNLSVRNIGEEAIHLRYDTTDSVVSSNSISYTGLTGPLYGEGVYVGTDPKNWCNFTNCRPDRSDRNAVYGNTIWGTPVEGIEAKAGTSNGLIANNVVNGTTTRDQFSGISVKGNEWVIEDNRVSGVGTRAISVQDSSSEGWGYDSVLSRNTVSSDGNGIGIWATARLRNIVSCDNVNTTQGAALSNLACQK